MVKHIFADDLDPGYLEIVSTSAEDAVSSVIERHLEKLDTIGTPRPELRHLGALPHKPVKILMNRSINWYHRYGVGSEDILDQTDRKSARKYPGASCFIGFIVPREGSSVVVQSGLRKDAIMTHAEIREKIAKSTFDKYGAGEITARDMCVVLHLPKIYRLSDADMLGVIKGVPRWVQVMDAHFGVSARD